MGGFRDTVFGFSIHNFARMDPSAKYYSDFRNTVLKVWMKLRSCFPVIDRVALNSFWLYYRSTLYGLGPESIRFVRPNHRAKSGNHYFGPKRT